MWEFMTDYANAFWTMEEKAAEVIEVLTAWVITLIPMILILSIAYGLAWCIKEELKENYRNQKKVRNDNGLENRHKRYEDPTGLQDQIRCRTVLAPELQQLHKAKRKTRHANLRRNRKGEG